MPRLTLGRISPWLVVATAATVILAFTPALAQSEDESPEGSASAEAVAVAAPILMQVARSDTYMSGTWEVAVGEVFTAPLAAAAWLEKKAFGTCHYASRKPPMKTSAISRSMKHLPRPWS